MSFVQPYFWSRPPGRVSQHWTQVLVTAPVLPVLTLDEAKSECRIDVVDEDALLQGYIDTATQQVEYDTGLKLLTQTWDLTAAGFSGSALELPFGPLQTVTHVKYTDTAGVLQTVLNTTYLPDTASPIGRIGLTDSATWPSDLRMFQPVTIRAVFGYVSIDLVPFQLVKGVGTRVRWFERRQGPTPDELAEYYGLIGSFVTRLVA